MLNDTFKNILVLLVEVTVRTAGMTQVKTNFTQQFLSKYTSQRVRIKLTNFISGNKHLLIKKKIGKCTLTIPLCQWQHSIILFVAQIWYTSWSTMNYLLTFFLQVLPNRTSLNSSASYLIMSNEDCFLWYGKVCPYILLYNN